MLLSILEKAKVIKGVYSENGVRIMGVGTVAAGYQNFLICIEMFFAAVALRFAFPYQLYAQQDVGVGHGRTVSLQSISSNLKETMNPKDIMTDAIHNFSPQYQQYTQFGNQPSQQDQQPRMERTPTQPTNIPPGNKHAPYSQANGTTAQPHPPQPNRKFNEKTTLLSSDDEFQ